MDTENKPINLGFFYQMDGTRTLLKCSKSNSVIANNFSKDGWYVYSYDSAATKPPEDTPYTLYFNHPPLSGLKTYLSSFSLFQDAQSKPQKRQLIHKLKLSKQLALILDIVQKIKLK